MKPNLRDALEAVAERCDEIVAVAEDESRKLSDLFAFKETNHSIKLCLDLAAELGRSSARDIHAEKGNIAIVHERIMLANSAIEDRITANPLVMSAVRCVQQLAYDSLVGTVDEIGNFTEIAAFLARHTVVTRTVFNALATVVHRQLRKSEKAKRKARTETKANGKGPQTDYKRAQRDVFAKFLKHHPAGSISIYTRSRECWRLHKSEWDKAAAEGYGYSSADALAQAFLP